MKLPTTTTPQIPGESLESQYGSGSTFASPVNVDQQSVHTEIVAVFPNQMDGAIQEESVGTERLSAEQLREFLATLQERSWQSNPFGAKVTLEAAITLLEKDLGLARCLFNGMQWGAQWELDKKDGLPADAYDLSPELNIPEQLARLQAIPTQIRDTAIQALRAKHSNIPTDAFERTQDDQRGPNEWEWLLLCMVSGPGMESMSEKDYRAAQEKLPRKQRLDQRGISWLEATPEQLASGVAPNGRRNEAGVYVFENDADDRSVIRGGRARARGSVV